MQASGHYGVPEVPSYLVGRGPPSHSHNMFNLSNDLPLSPSSGQGHPHHAQPALAQQQQQQQQHQQQQLLHHQQQTQHLQHPQQSQQHVQLQQAQQQQAQPQPQPQQQTQQLPPQQQQHSKQTQQLPPQQQQHSNNTLQQPMVQQQPPQLGVGSDSPKALSPIASKQPPNNFNKALAVVRDQSLAAEDHDGLAEDGERGAPGTRWPRQETLALLKLRSEMDATFRDASLKGPLWEELSRKLSEMGYHRSPKKCKEKFENVHKYYKRTKDGKAGRQDGKSYRFFSQLEALYGAANAPSNAGNSNAGGNITAGGSNSGGGLAGPLASGTSNAQGDRGGFQSARVGTGPSDGPLSAHRPELDYSSGLNFSSDSSDDDYEDPGESENPESRKRKRKSSRRFMVFFENLMKKVISKQEKMQQTFLEALERREHDRMIREEAWKRQEMARMSREHELRAQERSLAATRDAALVAFLQKVTGQTLQLPPIAIPAQPVSAAPDVHEDQNDRDFFDPNSKRWPKPEVLALIKLRSGLQPKFLEPGPKGPLWEEISVGMSSQGFSRSAKRCKEKWENINKYFKKAKESNRKRPENAKTCPYFHQLDTLYRKGLLGAAHNKQMTSKTGDHLPEDELMEQPSGSNREDSGHAQGGDSEILAIMPPEDQNSAPMGTPTSNGVATHFIPSPENGHNSERGSKKVKMKPGLVDSNLTAAAAVSFDGTKFLSGLSTKAINSEGQLQAKEDLLQVVDSQITHQQSAAEDYDKRDLADDDARDHAEAQQQKQLQYIAKERPIINNSLVHKFNDAQEYNIPASAHADQ